MQTDAQMDRKSGSQVNRAYDSFEKEYEEAVNEGQQYVFLGDLGKWNIGYKALEICRKWQRDQAKTVIKYAKDIRMAHPSNIYEYVSTCELFPEAIKDHVYETMKFITWSHCRAAARHAKRLREQKGEIVDFETVMDWLASANTSDISVEDFAASLASGLIDTWLTKRKRIPAKIMSAVVHDPDKPKDRKGIVTLEVDWSVIQTIHDLMQTNESQKDFIEHLALKWFEKVEDKKK